MRSLWSTLLGIMLAAFLGCSPAEQNGASQGESTNGSELEPPTVSVPDEDSADDPSGGAAQAAGPSTGQIAQNAIDQSAEAGPGAASPAADDEVAVRLKLQELLAQDKLDDAVALVRSQLEKDPSNEDWRQLSVELLRMLQRYDDAVAMLEPMLAAEKPSPYAIEAGLRIHWEAAQVAKQDGNEAEAQKHFIATGDFARKLLNGDLTLDDRQKEALAEIFLHEAAALVAQQQTERGVAAARTALELGLSDFQKIRDNPELAVLMEDESFRQDVDRAEEAMKARYRELVKTEMAEFTPFDFTFALPNLEGQTVSLDEYKGKVVIADIWGTWCGPCRMEIPHFVRLQDAYANAGLQIIGLTYEDATVEETRKIVEPVIAELGINYPCLVGDEATLQKVPNFQGFPTTIFIDREGKVRLTMIGLQPHAKLEAAVKLLLEDEVAQTPPAADSLLR